MKSLRDGSVLAIEDLYECSCLDRKVVDFEETKVSNTTKARH